MKSLTRKNTISVLLGCALIGTMAMITMPLLSCSTDITTLQGFDTTVSENGIILVPDNAPTVLKMIFKNYTNVIAPNGKPIHIFATSGVSDAQLTKSRDVMQFILKDAPGTRNGSDKTEIANEMANRNATLVFFDTQAQSMLQRGLVANLDLFVQDLYATETPVEGSSSYLDNSVRDAAYEEIFHLVQGSGIQYAMPDFHQEIVAAEKKARAAGIYRYGTDDDPETNPYEYIISCTDVYLGLWAHSTEGNSFGNEYDPTTRANLKTIDPTGYELVESFYLPYQNRTITLDSTFMGTFDLNLDKNSPYTLKSRYLQDIKLSGNLNANIVGNELDNTLTGNEGFNTVYFKGKAAEYTVIKLETGTTVTDNIPNRDGSDLLINIEKVAFTDSTITL